MSNSIFKEVTDDLDNKNGSLVITVKKNGTLDCDDNEALQNWLAGKADINPAISVLRETSPTPSILEEIETEKQQKREELRQKIILESEEELDEDEIEKRLKELEKDDETLNVKHVSLCLEEYIPPEYSKNYAKEVLNMAGIDNPETLLHDYEYQRMTIQNDHCYTTLTMAINPRIALKKLSAPESRKPEESISEPVKKIQRKDDSQEIKEENDDSDDEQTDESESESTEVSFSEDDDEDDLDFNVNDRFGQKKPTKRQRRKLAAKRARKQEKMQHQEGDPEPIPEVESPKEPKIRKTKSPKKTLSRTNSLKDFSTVTTPVANPPAKKNIVIYPQAIQGTSGTQKPLGNIVIVKNPKNLSFGNSINSANPGAGFKTIIDRKFIGGTVVVTRRLIPIQTSTEQQPEIAAASVEPTKVIFPPKVESVVKTEQVIAPPAEIKPVELEKKIEPMEDVRFGEFVPLAAAANLKTNQIPEQISVQTHQNSNDLVNELLVNFDTPVTTLATNLEQQLPPPVLPTQSTEIEHMDLDDGLPEDILQHVAKLVEHKEIQEIIDNVHEFPDLKHLTETDTMSPNTSITSILPTASVVSTPSTPTLTQSILDLQKEKAIKSLPKKSPIRVVRSDGRVIELPPIEAPTTRGAKRRAQGSDASPVPISTSVSKLPKVEKTPSVKDPDSRASSRRSSLAKSEKDGTASGKSSRRQSNVLNETDDMETDGSWNSEDDPDRLWCICKQPHNNRFMICCDKCEDWFHGKCVNITKAMGREMEQKGKEWTCPNCKQNMDGSANGTVGSGKKSLNQQKLTKFFLKNEKSEDESKAAPGMCVICNIKPARNDSVYCSDECIRSHANKHIDESKKSTSTPTTPLPPGTSSTHSSHSHHSSHHHHHHHSHHSHSSSGSNTSHHVKKESSASNSPSTSTGTTITKSGENKKFSNILKDKNNKVLVYEKTTGKILSLSISPTTSTLNEWLKKNPHCDIVKPGSPQAEMFTKRGEKKQLHHVTTPPIKDEPCLFSNPAKIHTGVVPATKKGDPKQRVAGQLSPLASMSPRPPLLKSDSTSSIGSKTPGSPGKNSKSGGSQKMPREQPKLKRQSSSGSSSSKESKLRVEIDRLNVRKTLKDTLIQRMVEITNPSIKKMTDDEAEDFADRIEQAMFEFNHKDTKDKYKTKYRSLKFNLSDTKNPTLIEKICCKVLSPKQLVELPASALASEELAKWREQESKHQLEIITKCELDALTQNQSHVVKTHKGEEIIEAKETIEELEINNPIHAVNNDVLKTETAEASSSKDRFESYINKTISSSEKQVSNSPLSSPSVSSSTSKKDSRRSRSRSRSRGREHDHHHHHHHHSKSSSKHKKRKSRSKSRERHRSREDKRRSRSRERDRKHEKKSEKRDKDKPEVKEKKEVTSSVKMEHKKDDIIVKEEDCNLIDKILAETGCQLKVERPGAPAHIPAPKEEDKPQEVKVEITDESGSQIVSSNETFDEEKLEHPAEKLPDSYFDPDPIDEHPIPISIYSGKLYMVDVAKFDITASIVSGHAEDIVKDIPKVLEVVGRISPRTVWDYVSKLKKIPTKEIVVIRFGSTDEENYDNLFTYLSSKERYGVIKSGTSSIKDFYLVTVEAKKPLPQALLPIDGPGFVEGDNKPDLLIGIIVKMSSDAKQTRKPPAKVAKKSSSSSSSSSSAYKHAPKGDVTNIIDSIIQMAPSGIKSPKTTKLTAGLPVTEIPIKILPTSSKDEDDDEPYSPGDSDEDFQKPLSTMKTTSYDETLEKINRAIAARQAEIDLLQNKKTTDNLNEPYSPTGPLSPSSKDDKLPSSSGIFENISLPANIGDILASIKNVTSTSSSGTVQKMEDDSEEYVPASVSVSNYEYRSSSITYPAAASSTTYQPLPLTTPIVPGPLVNPMTMDIDERVFPIGIPIVPPPSTKLSSGDSKLAKMSTEDLLKMVPDFDTGKPENE